ncbi:MULTISPECIES: DUF484 family protein [unclassified Meridianimarinicoccus]|uniref:DUF484 family protein n=1 Tax=unclassified Meridianimarinicoccus TaxID=2923344 RepID=UPI001868F622|nr:DUF484 family protein [Fluviibacterium sp. MJW13]
MSTDTLASAETALRDLIVADPERVLNDPHILQALLRAEDQARGGNVVDMRGMTISRLEDRLARLEQTHQSVITAAYDNVATTAQVHRAILAMIEPLDFDAFLGTLDTTVAETLRLRAVRLALESEDRTPDSDLNPLTGTLSLLPPGYLDSFVTEGRRMRNRPVILRQVTQGAVSVYGTAAADIRSEALVWLDLGPDRVPGLLVLGAQEPEHFAPGQATDLLELFARICGRLVRGWLG